MTTMAMMILEVAVEHGDHFDVDHMLFYSNVGLIGVTYLAIRDSRKRDREAHEEVTKAQEITATEQKQVGALMRIVQTLTAVPGAVGVSTRPSCPKGKHCRHNTVKNHR